MGRLYDIIQAHIDAQQFGASVRKVALAIGVSPTTVSNWRNITELPSRENLEAIARVTGVKYEEVFLAASIDAGYIKEPSVESVVLQRRAETMESDLRGLAYIDGIRNRMSAPVDTTDTSVQAAHDEVEPIERGQGHDDNA